MERADMLAEIKKKGLTVEQAAEKVGVSRRTLFNYMDKFGDGELSKKIFDSLAVALEFDKSFVDQYNFILKNEGLKLNCFWPFMLIPGGEVKNVWTFLDSPQNITNSLLEGLPVNKYSVFKLLNNNMAPTIGTGDLVLCEEVAVKDWYRVADFFIYFMVGNDNSAHVGRIYKGQNDTWYIKSDNKAEIAKFDSSALEGLFLVRRIIKLQEAAPKMFDVPKE